MKEEVKAMIVKRPSDGRTYILFVAATMISAADIGDAVIIKVKSVIRPVATGHDLPYPVEVYNPEAGEIVAECLPQIEEYSGRLWKRWTGQ